MEQQRRIIQEEKPATKYERADDKNFNAEVETAIGQVMDEAERKFLEFVTTQCNKMEHKLMFDGSSSPSLYELDIALMEHSHVMLALTGLYEQARWDLSKAKKAYNEWYAFKFIEIRTEVNDPKLPQSKWYKESEIDYMITTKYARERAKLETEIELCESKRSSIQRLIDSWNSYGYQLNTLSKNGQAEMRSSGLSDKLGEDDDSGYVSNLAQSALGGMGD